MAATVPAAAAAAAAAATAAATATAAPPASEVGVGGSSAPASISEAPLPPAPTPPAVVVPSAPALSSVALDSPGTVKLKERLRAAQARFDAIKRSTGSGGAPPSPGGGRPGGSGATI
jgi:hypothetical protein